MTETVPARFAPLNVRGRFDPEDSPAAGRGEGKILDELK
jgi:hypothetical protein